MRWTYWLRCEGVERDVAMKTESTKRRSTRHRVQSQRTGESSHVYSHDSSQYGLASSFHSVRSVCSFQSPSKMSTYTREELFDACRRGDMECLRRAAASGVALKTVAGYWQGGNNVSLLHIACGNEKKRLYSSKKRNSKHSAHVLQEW